MARLEFLTDPRAFLEAAAPVLAADPLVATVVATVTANAVRDDETGTAPRPDVPRWWVVLRDGDQVVSAAMRTARAAPHPLFLLPMPEAEARTLARTLHERGEQAPAVNGALPAVRAYAEELARLTGGAVTTVQHIRLHEVRRVLPPPAPVAGALRPATVGDLDLVAAWFARFMADADEQAGRPRGSSPAEVPDRASVRRRIEGGTCWLWCDPDGRPVHLTAGGPPSFGVARIGPVYTPPTDRGHGYASAAVAEVSRRLLGQGARVCLFTDQANPTSNALYARLGYEPVVDMANLLVAPAPGAGSRPLTTPRTS
jgi:GNAT superfamily N-acetyltransferase